MHPARPRSRLAAAAAVAVAVSAAGLLAGCGEDSEPPLSETLPSCEEIWTAGNTLPEDYDGCRDEEGTLQVSSVQECTKSEDRITEFGTDHYALLGGRIYDDGKESANYQSLYQACFGASW